MLAPDVILTKSEAALEFLFCLSLVGSTAFDSLEKYLLKRERH